MALLTLLSLILVSQSFGMESSDNAFRKLEAGNGSTAGISLDDVILSDHFLTDQQPHWDDDTWLIQEISFSPLQNVHFSADEAGAAFGLSGMTIDQSSGVYLNGGGNDEDAVPRSTFLSSTMDDLTLIPTSDHFVLFDQDSRDPIMQRDDHHCTAPTGGQKGQPTTSAANEEEKRPQKQQHNMQKQRRPTESKKAQKLPPLKRQKSGKKSSRGKSSTAQKILLENANKNAGNNCLSPICQEAPTAEATNAATPINFVSYVFGQSLKALSPDLFNKSVENIKRSFKMTKKESIESLINQMHQTDPKNVFGNLQSFFANAKADKGFSMIISEVQAQTEFLFGQRIFNDDENAFNTTHFMFNFILMEKTFGRQSIEFEKRTNFEKDRAAILRFFYLRMYRKFVGTLEAPFGGVHNDSNRRKHEMEMSDRETLLHCINMARTQINKEQQKMTSLEDIMTRLEEFDLIREGMELAQFTILHTIAPLLNEPSEREELFALTPQCLLAKFSDILGRRSVAQMVLECQNEHLFEQVRATARESNRTNVSTTFFRLFDGIISLYYPFQITHDHEVEDAETQTVRKMLWNVRIYRELYVRVNLHLQLKGKEMAAKNASLKRALDILAQFLTESVGQMAELLSEWDKWQTGGQ